jgi:glycosyltransferase involved in cell wall biosynthesis
MGSLFSIIIPTLNEEENLEACLHSITQQTYEEYEVFIVDGGSDDGTIEVAERYGFEILEAEKRRPHDVAYAKNLGARRSSGEFLFFMDADTVMAPNCLEVFEACFEKPSVVAVLCRVLPLKGRPLERLMYELNNAARRLSNVLGVYELSYFSCPCYRRSCFEKAGGFREDLYACEDLDLALRSRHLGRYIYTSMTILWTSPRRLRRWTYHGYIARYLRYLAEYYLLDRVTVPYEDLH